MIVIKHIKEKFSNTKKLNDTFVGTPPYPMIVLDEFLPTDLALELEKECNTIPDHHWTEFTRRGSNVKECINMSIAPVAENFVNQFHSQQFMKWLIEMTGIKDLIPDPYLIGAGYSKIRSGSSLKIHTDFNWNDTIKVHRMLSFIIYLNSNWKEEWGGHLQFNDFQNKNVIQRVPPLFNRAILWRHHKKGFHGFPDPLTCPENITRNAFRLFFYVSNAEYDSKDLPHRSLYWFDEETGEPYDIPTEK